MKFSFIQVVGVLRVYSIVTRSSSKIHKQSNPCRVYTGKGGREGTIDRPVFPGPVKETGKGRDVVST